MISVTLSWAWANRGRRWHLRAAGADLALCGVGARGWKWRLYAAFGRADIPVLACIHCLRVMRRVGERTGRAMSACALSMQGRR